MTSLPLRRVLVIGTGMIGTSVALGLRRAGIEVALSDLDAGALATAVGLGAGVAVRPADPPADIVVIATPPSTVAGVLLDAQRRRLGTVYTDVASTKARIVAEAEQAGCDLGSFVPGHPLSGRALAGPGAAQADLFAGRPWILCPHPRTRLYSVRLMTELVAACGAELRLLALAAHDRVVAAVSHAPHMVSAALAARFAAADDTVRSLIGRGLLDTTRVAGGPPGLWCDIYAHNTDAVATVIEAVIADLTAAAAALRAGDLDGTVADLLHRGNLGRANITGSTAGTAGAGSTGGPGGPVTELPVRSRGA